MPHEEVKGALNSLMLREYVTMTNKTEERFELLPDGQDVMDNGSLEYRIFQELADGPVSKDDLANKFGKVFNFSFPYGMKNRWYKLNKKEGTLERVAESAEDSTKTGLQSLIAGEVSDKKTVQNFTKRKMVSRKKFVWFEASKGPNF